MSTYTQILYHIVFGTKYRKPVLTMDVREDLFRYMTGILRNKNCHVYCINGVEDHLHIITHLHPTVALSQLVKDLKIASSLYIKRNRFIPNFNGWQSGYAAFTYSQEALQNLIKYVENQEMHHRKLNYRAELEVLLKEHHVVFDPKYLL